MSRPTVLYGLLARHVVIDRASNYATIVNTIEDVGVPTDVFKSLAKGTRATAKGEMVLYLLLSWEWPTSIKPAQATLHLRLRTAGGYVGTTIEVTTNTGTPSVRSRLLVHIQAFPVDIPGIYTFEVLQGGDVTCSIPFAVKAIDPSELDVPADLRAQTAKRPRKAAPTKAPAPKRRKARSRS